MKPHELIELERELLSLKRQLSQPAAELTLDPNYNYDKYGDFCVLNTEVITPLTDPPLPNGAIGAPVDQEFSYTTDSQADFFAVYVTGKFFITNEVTFDIPVWINFRGEADNRYFSGNTDFMHVELALGRAGYPVRLPVPKGYPQQSRIIVTLRSQYNFGDDDYFQMAFIGAKRRAHRTFRRAK